MADPAHTSQGGLSPRRPGGLGRVVFGMLDVLTEKIPVMRWESICAFSDGISRTIIQLNIYDERGNVQVGRIAFRIETGEVLNFYYRNYEGESPEVITDLILDIYNLETRRRAG